MSTSVATTQSPDEIMENVVIKGDLSRLTPEQRGAYYMTVCKSVGLNPLTKPFEYITLNGKLTLYALRNCTDQLRTIHGVSVVEMNETERDGVFIVTCKVSNRDARTDIAKGAVNIASLKGEALANAMMKAETKAKRRATLSICGLGFLDETEIEDIPQHAKTLPKKDARDTYTKLQKEIDEAKTRDELRHWGEASAERIGVLPHDWQDLLRLRYQERLCDLQYHEEKQIEAKPGQQEPFDENEWLRDLEGAFSGCEEMAEFFEIDKTSYHPDLAKASPTIRKRAAKMREEHFVRLGGAEPSDNKSDLIMAC